MYLSPSVTGTCILYDDGSNGAVSVFKQVDHRCQYTAVGGDATNYDVTKVSPVE
jgi:hypothetical protein